MGLSRPVEYMAYGQRPDIAEELQPSDNAAKYLFMKRKSVVQVAGIEPLTLRPEICIRH